MLQYQKAKISIIITVLLFLLYISFLGEKHNWLHAKSRYKQGKVLSSYHLSKERCRLWREINTLPSISSFMDRVFSLFRQKTVRVASVRNGHQSGCSRANTINKNINKRSNIFSYREKILEYNWKNNLKYGKNKVSNTKRFMIACYIN